jgi:uncharacterized membrane protein HdeD (DUF308 family)
MAWMNKKSVSDLTSDWWAVGLRGILALVAGVVIFLTPLPHTERLLRVFGAYLILDGAIALVMAGLAARRHESWARSTLNGVLGVFFGLTNLIGGGLPVVLRADLIALRTFLTGVSGIIVARQLRDDLPEMLPAWLLMLSGVGSVIFSVVIFLGPTLEERLAGQLDWLAAVYLIGFGFLLLAVAIRLRTLSRRAVRATTV